MNSNQMTRRQSNVWLLAAMAAPLAKTASVCSWPAVLILGSITLGIGGWLTMYPAEPRPWVEALQGLWGSVVASELLYGCGDCWPSHSNPKAAALILLALCVWANYKGRQRGARIGCMLVWPVGLLLGLIMLLAAPEVRLQNLYPSWEMPDAALVTILLVPTLYKEQETKIRIGGRGVLLCFALAISLITAGVLSPRVSSGAGTGVYELSRSISGVSQRLESIAAAALTMGYFGGIGYLLSIPEKTSNRGRMVVTYGALAGLLFLMDIRLDSRIMAIGSILIWAILPFLGGLQKYFQKTEKSY